MTGIEMNHLLICVQMFTIRHSFKTLSAAGKYRRHMFEEGYPPLVRCSNCLAPTRNSLVEVGFMVNAWSIMMCGAGLEQIKAKLVAFSFCVFGVVAIIGDIYN